jgi:hypothetical protein
MARCLLKGVALSKFEESALAQGAKTMLRYKDVMSNLAYYVFPLRAIQVQNHYMQCYMLKSQILKMKECMAQVEVLNNYLKMFPG